MTRNSGPHLVSVIQQSTVDKVGMYACKCVSVYVCVCVERKVGPMVRKGAVAERLE